MEQFECIELKTENEEQISVVKFKDEKVMDPGRIEQLGNELMEVASRDDNCKLLINFDNVRFFSSQAINKLIVLDRRVKAGGGQIRLSNLRPEVRDLFSYTNLDSVFEIRDEEEDALQSFQ
ncbi:MAG: anti-sigma factor antagonist [Planctomycetota bacterium]